MKTLIKTLFTIFSLFLLQILTFYTISESFLIKKIGRYHESFVLEFEENKFRNFGVLTDLNITEEQIQKSFKLLGNHKLLICQTPSDCESLRKSDGYFIYYFNAKNRNPFKINLIQEAEFAEAYGADWESSYVWILFKWILLEKRNIGIS